MTNNLKSLFRRAYQKAREESIFFGLIGKHNPDTTISFEVTGRADYLWVTLEDKTVVQARNEAGVPQTEDLPVKLRVDHGTHIIVSRSNNNSLALPTPTPPSGVFPHPIADHSDVVLTSEAAGDVLVYDGDDWINETPIVVSAGAGDAGKLVRLDAGGKVDATTINDPDIDHTAITNIGSNTHAQIDTALATAVTNDATAAAHIAATAAHGATGAVVGTTNAQTLTNKTLDSTNISTLTAKNPPVDADSAVIVDSAASNVFKRVTYTNVKAFLKTYFDTLYGQLAAANTWTQNQIIASTQVTGNALRVIRDLASASTDAPVVDIVQDNAGDDQDALRVQQDGTGPIITGYDAATKVFELSDGGTLSVYTVIKALSASGIQFQDDGGNASIIIPDWGAGGARLGLGTTDVEAVPSNFGAMQLGLTGYIIYGRSGSTGLYFANNAYYDGAWKRRTADVATLYNQLNASGHSFSHAVTGIIDSAVTWVEIMRLMPNGMGIFQASPDYPLHVGTGTITPGGFGGANAVVKALFTDTTAAKFTQVAISGDVGGAVQFYDSGSGAAIADFGISIATASLAFINRITSGIFEVWTHNGTALAVRLAISALGTVLVKAGFSADVAAVGGVMYVDYTAASNSGAGEDELAAYTVPADVLSTNGDSLWFEAWGITANNTNVKNLFVRFGTAGTNLLLQYDVGTTALNRWMLRGRIIRTGAATQIGSLMLTKTNTQGIASGSAALNQTLSGTVKLAVNGESVPGTSTDITCEGFIVGWQPNNT